METLKGNPNLRKSLLDYNKLKPGEDVIDEFPDLVDHDDFLKYLTWLSKNIPSKSITIRSSKSTILVIYSFTGMLDQANGKYPIAAQRTKEKRYVLLSTNYGDSDFVISYHPDKKEYVITQESARYMLLHRAINNLFGQKGPQLVRKFKTFKEAFAYIDKKVKVSVTYYSQKHDENWYNGEETDYQKKRRKGFVRGLAGSGGAMGASIALGSDDSNIRAYGKIARARLADLSKEGEVEANKLRVQLMGLARPEDEATYNRFLEAVDKRLEHNRAATERFAKRAKKIANKKLIKNVGKGTLIGLGVGNGLAYLTNKGIKSVNEKGNAARRNRKK